MARNQLLLVRVLVLYFNKESTSFVSSSATTVLIGYTKQAVEIYRRLFDKKVIVAVIDDLFQLPLLTECEILQPTETQPTDLTIEENFLKFAIDSNTCFLEERNTNKTTAFTKKAIAAYNKKPVYKKAGTVERLKMQKKWQKAAVTYPDLQLANYGTYVDETPEPNSQMIKCLTTPSTSNRHRLCCSRIGYTNSNKGWSPNLMSLRWCFP